MSFKIIPYQSKEYEKAVELREEILRKPLGLSFSLKELEAEKEHIHIAGYKGKELCATAVLVPEGDAFKMQRVAVKKELQARGIGSALMAFCEEYAQKQGIKEIYCYSRDLAVPFYLKNGYVTEGEYFNEDGIPHLKMKKNLSSGFSKISYRQIKY